MRPELEEIQERIERDHEAFLHVSALRIKYALMEGVQEWQETNPNHTVKFIEAMGLGGFYVDGVFIDEILQKCYGVYSFKRLNRVLEPLFELHFWYADIADEVGITVEFEVPARSKSGNYDERF